MEVKSTTENSKIWQIWHGFNYFFGGASFLVGSFILFPYFSNIFDSANVSAWLYTLGSSTFLLADITQWKHYKKYSPKFNLKFNFFISVLGSLLYLTGSACYIPKIDKAEYGEDQFIIGSALIVLSQTWKVFRVLNQPDRTWKQNFEDDKSGFFVDIFAGLGGVMYLVGTILFKESIFDAKLLIIGIAFYSFGGLFFFTSATFMQRRYFFQEKSIIEYSPATSMSMEI